MIRHRAPEWPRDEAALARLDTSFATEVVYELVTDRALTFALVERRAEPPIVKPYDVDWRALAQASWARVAEDGAERLVGVIALAHQPWNRRVVVTDLYVDGTARGRGIGAGLLADADAHAWSLDARCLWVETQNVNVRAIRFYERQGFVCCGLDTTLYDPRELPGEVAVYFARALASPS